jgi:TonB-dependent SusC/RagA subfamily outer membrane receptor
MVYQLITVTQTALTKQLVEEVMITVMLRLTSIQTTLSQLTLKGAAATALYGSRASNGVVMIVMKKVETEKVLV